MNPELASMTSYDTGAMPGVRAMLGTGVVVGQECGRSAVMPDWNGWNARKTQENKPFGVIDALAVQDDRPTIRCVSLRV